MQRWISSIRCLHKSLWSPIFSELKVCFSYMEKDVFFPFESREKRLRIRIRKQQFLGIFFHFEGKGTSNPGCRLWFYVPLRENVKTIHVLYAVWWLLLKEKKEKQALVENVLILFTFFGEEGLSEPGSEC